GDFNSARGGKRGNPAAGQCEIRQADPHGEGARVGLVGLGRLQPAIDPSIEGFLRILADAGDSEGVRLTGSEKRRRAGDLACLVHLSPDLRPTLPSPGGGGWGEGRSPPYQRAAVRDGKAYPFGGRAQRQGPVRVHVVNRKADAAEVAGHSRPPT